MASYLGEYSGNYGRCASDRVNKFHRAVQSVMDQDSPSWELLIVADGCDTTWEQQHRYSDQRIRFLRIPKQRLWSGKVRNAGIHLAIGERVVYLDTDDMLAPEHLSSLAEGLRAAGSPPWAVCNDWIWDDGRKDFVERVAAPTRENGIGTSNLIHQRGIYWPEPEYRWPDMGYDHDRVFYKALLNTGAPIHIQGGRYLVCHIPRQYDI